MDVSKLITRQQIVITDKKGVFIKEWSPYLHTLGGSADFYRINEYVGGVVEIDESVPMLLAKQIMPAAGFSWIATNQRLLNKWLSSFAVDKGRQTRGLILTLQLVKEEMQRAKLAGECLEPISVERIMTPELEVAEDFLKWVRDSVENKALSVNQEDSMVHRVESGVLLVYPNLFQEFCSVYSRHILYVVLFTQFNHLGLFKWSGWDFRFEQFFAEYPSVKGKRLNNMHEVATEEDLNLRIKQGEQFGLLIPEPKLIFKGKAPELSPQVR
jgi:hypothetical protein